MRWATITEGNRVTRFDADRLSMVDFIGPHGSIEDWYVAARQPEGYVCEQDFGDEQSALSLYSWLVWLTKDEEPPPGLPLDYMIEVSVRA